MLDKPDSARTMVLITVEEARRRDAKIQATGHVPLGAIHLRIDALAIGDAGMQNRGKEVPRSCGNSW